MAIHCQLLFTTILYSLVLINGILNISSLAYSKSDYAGACFLYVREDNSKQSPVPCTATIYTNGGVAAYAAVMAIYHGYGTIVASRDSHIGRTMWVMPWLLSNGLAMILMFISACVYSFGVYITCSNVSAITKLTESCSYSNKHFKSIFMCEISAWISVILWISLIAIEAIRLRRNRRALAREVYNDPDASDAVKIGTLPPSA